MNYDPAVDNSVFVIRPSNPWQPVNWREIWHFKDLLVNLAARDVKLRYRQTALGAIWVVLQPLLSALLFAFVFGMVARLPSGRYPYFIFAYAGLLGWTAFSGTLGKTSSCLIVNSHLVSKVFFPRLILPLATLWSTAVDFAVAFGIMIVLMGVYRIPPHPGLLLLPLWLIFVMAISFGFGLINAALIVRYRDIQYIVPVITQVLMYASPVAYMVSMVPARLHTLYMLNPLVSLLDAIRWSVLGIGHPEWGYLAYAMGVAAALLIAGFYAFKNMERSFADVI